MAFYFWKNYYFWIFVAEFRCFEFDIAGFVVVGWKLCFAKLVFCFALFVVVVGFVGV